MGLVPFKSSRRVQPSKLAAEVMDKAGHSRPNVYRLFTGEEMTKAPNSRWRP